MTALLNWFLHGRCLRHSDPLFDRDDSGPIFRCPRCLHSWPRLQTPQVSMVSRRVVPVAAPEPRRPSRRMSRRPQPAPVGA